MSTVRVFYRLLLFRDKSGMSVTTRHSLHSTLHTRHSTLHTHSFTSIYVQDINGSLLGVSYTTFHSSITSRALYMRYLLFVDRLFLRRVFLRFPKQVSDFKLKDKSFQELGPIALNDLSPNIATYQSSLNIGVISTGNRGMELT